MSDEVSNFLRSVEQLNHGRHEEEEARSKELEEKLLQQRKERQARREERARSISPQKSSPANTPPPSARHRDSTPQPTEASSPIPDLSARLQNQVGAAPPLSADAMDLPSPRSVSPTKETVLDFEPNRSSASYNSPPSSGVPARTPTLSWQRRPPSQGPDRPRSRPLSMVAAENAAARSNTPPAEAASPSQTPSRDQISQALASKDPAWFRQTADRGATSAAYRKNQVEDEDTVDVATSRSQLPGTSQTTSTEPDKEPARERPTSQISLGRLGSPLLTTDAVKLGPPADIQASKDGTSSGQTSPTRPASPTKGMGGFVQSAMMKRTDSVKRWSVTTPGLQRGNGSNRNSLDGKNIATSPGPEPLSRPVSRSRDSTSRPVSSHAKDLASTTSGATSPEDGVPEPSKLEPPVDNTPPTSPSKTMDPRRWSPTKGSWLDAALNKPESPKPKPAAPPSNQPAWMVELNRAKAEKAKNSSVDLGRAGSTVKKHEVKTGGLVRPAPPGTAVKPPSLAGLPSPSLGADKPLTPGLRTSMTRSDSNTRISPASEKPGAGAEDLGRRGSVISPVAKDKPEAPPQMDFRAGLRPRGLTVGKDSDKEPEKAGLRARGATVGRDSSKEPVNELANVFGQLRKTKTQNYVAPDVLKDNITRGKSALNVTGGPRPYEKKDEFKDAILKKKADFKQAKEQGRGVATNEKPPEEKAIPEGLARRATITRSGSIPHVSHSRDTSTAKSPSETSAKPFESSRSSMVSVTSPRDIKVDTAPVKVENKEEMPSPSKPEPRNTGPVSPKKVHEQVSTFPLKQQVNEDKKDDVQPPSPRKLDVKRMSRFLDESGPQSPKGEPEPVRSPSPLKKTFGSPTSPRKLPLESEKGETQPAVSASNGANVFGGSVTPKKPQPQTDKPLPEPLDLRPRSPTKTHATRDPPSPSRTSAYASPSRTPTRSPSKSAGDVSAMINGFFGNQRPKRNYHVDAAELLMNRPKGGSRVQTHKAQLFQVTEQGKKIPVPAHYERVLFEREMYICSHTFTDEARKRVSEVYFWSGDEVAPSAVEDAQVFVNKEVKSIGGTLIKMRQGKETAEFIQALGGIVIIRRGSSNKYDSLASNILCGRQFLGQIVFDEVDFSSSSLCSGFPYLITQQGKCYLWKGKGAGVDELSCARLIGMDLALMGELVEMDEGQEPENFWDFFGGDRRASLSSADHWRLKPSYEKYCGRLFCSDSAAQNQVTELNPFSQMDLSPDRIYVLDAFFEMYVIVGRYTQAQYGSFRNALDFAQEYAILAAGMEDRPFVPVSTVVMEGIPRDLRSCFRKWRDDLSPTKMLPPSSGGGGSAGRTSPLKRARSLRVMPLVQALQVLGNSE
ncbi:hypothetical protein INS49_006829 [Diaporthe citri]|uniref:uncharacterized protein n=1 Tax=Diaporthe citri TaxID=83186 RepID=UPI001C7EF17A|nr:uncharacterized protein INS49_006829 [Diaporthe citri]KAG6365220.1 hypothetical protein INS49_006829 [Diaporthe citri]